MKNSDSAVVSESLYTNVVVYPYFIIVGKVRDYF